MKIDTGLFPHMVLQRTGKGSRAAITGSAEYDGTLKARITKKGKAVAGFANKAVGKVKSGKLTGAITGLPTGGPYRIELSVGKDKAVIDDVLVGDVWITGGQSNMQGCGRREGAAKPDPMVRAFYFHDEWKIAKEPVHNLWEAVDEAHYDLGIVRGQFSPHAGVGPGIAFAKDMLARTGIPQGLIACAHGGTSMSQWDPKRKAPSNSTLYSATLRRVRKNGGNVAGMIWYQGESDATVESIPHYTKRMQALVRTLRRDLKAPNLPWAVVQLGRLVSGMFPAHCWNEIQEQQRLLPDSIKNLTVVPAIDLPLDDSIHIGADGQQRLGKRLAYAMDALLRGRKAGLPPIALRTTETSQCHPGYGWRRATFVFDNVVGKLHTNGGRPGGATIGDPEPGPFIYDIRTEGNKVHMNTLLTTAALESRVAAYGSGIDPYCNIVDEADRSIPVFAPQRIGDFRAITQLATTFRVALPVELPQGVDGKLNGLKAPSAAELTTMPWKTRSFTDRFCDIHNETAQYGKRNFLIYFACEVNLPETMKLITCFGYDGPAKIFIDGKEIFHDPTGTNPASEDKGKAKWNASKGQHKLLIALGSNMGSAWGIYLRFERLGLTKAQQNRGDFLLPTTTA